MGPPRGVVGKMALACALALGGCRIDVGAVPDAAPCRPSPVFFRDHVRTEYLDSNHCAQADCHGPVDGHGYFRLAPFGNTPVTDTVDSWPPAWRDNYLGAIQLVRCDDATRSRLLTVPEGRADPHPADPADQVSDHNAAEDLFRQWVLGI